MPSFHILSLAPDASRRREMEAILRAAGHVLVTATTPGEAVGALATPGLDFLALDLRLPGLDMPRLQEALNPATTGQPDSLEAAERRHIALTLQHTHGNRRQAARILGIARSTMLAKLRKYGLESVGNK
ncbi:MAG: helix-turn-helix domain-containing protein [Gemmatimonadota bacterium]